MEQLDKEEAISFEDDMMLTEENEELKQTDKYVEEGNPKIRVTQSTTSGGSLLKFIIPIAVILIVVIVGMVFISGVSKKKAKQEAEAETLREQMRQEAEQEMQEQEEPTIATDYFTEEQLSELRASGYTGDEIETAAAEGRLYDDMIQEAEKAREEYIEKEIAPLYDTSSKEFKKIYKGTWMSLKKTKDSKLSSDPNDYETEIVTILSDYQKIGIYGGQCWLKVTLNKKRNKFGFFTVPAYRYNSLSENKGNIAIEITWLTDINSGEKCIQEIKEIEVE